MTNWCTYRIKVVGKKENIQKFEDWLNAGYTYCGNNISPNMEESVKNMQKAGWNHYAKRGHHLYSNSDKHFFRVDSVHEEKTVEVKGDGKIAKYLHGVCAWSVYSCMMPGTYTYYFDAISGVHGELALEHATNLLLASEELGLDIEVYSKEPGVGFAEHYLIKQGELEIDDETEYRCQWDEDPVSGEEEIVEFGGFNEAWHI